MSLFGNLIQVVVRNPVVSGSAGAFIASVFAVLVGQTEYAALLFVAGIVLAGWQIYASTR